MQRLSTTIAVTPKGRIINSYTVDYQTVFMVIMETQVSKLTENQMYVEIKYIRKFKDGKNPYDNMMSLYAGHNHMN
jgi:hypothetical protein